MAKTVKKEAIKKAPVKKVISFHLSLEEAKRIHDALMCCVAHVDTRHYLNGVCFESSDDGLLAVATDGHRFGRLKLKPIQKKIEGGKTTWEPLEQGLPKRFSVIAPTAFIKRLGGIDADLLRFSCTMTIDDGWIHYKDQNEGFSAKLIEGQFPDWRKVMPADANERALTAAFNGRHLAQLGSSLRKVHGKWSAVAMRIKDKESAAILHSSRNQGIDLTYLLMPMHF